MVSARWVSRARRGGWLGGVLCVAVAGGWAPGAAVAGEAAMEGEGAACAAGAVDPMRVGLVISGGVSLGAYQAGATYALVAYLRGERQRSGGEGVVLDVATGASAGNINAILAALSWCDADGAPQSPWDNDFYETWIDVGWQHLSPADPRWAAYGEVREVGEGEGRATELAYADEPPRDGLLTRWGFEEAQARLKARLAQGSFRESCEVAVGVTVNRVDPQLHSAEDAAGETLWAVQAQRYVVPMTVAVVDGGTRVEVRNMALDAAQQAAVGLSMALEAEGAISAEALLGVVRASSAFPAAFGPVELRFCEPAREVCERGGVAEFSDGGLFDNIPLGLAQVLVGEEGAGVERRYAYVDSDLRRARPVVPPRRVRPEGTAAAVDLMGRLVTEGRQYELLGLQRVGKTAGVQTSSRFHPLMGDVFMAFGGFLHRAFREYDYRVGLYDGIYTLAELRRARVGCGSPAETFAMVRDAVLGGGGGQDELLRAFVTRLFEWEMALRNERVEWGEGAGGSMSKARREEVFKGLEAGHAERARGAWAVAEVLHGFDLERRRQHRIGTSAEREAAEARLTDVVAIVDRLQRDHPGVIAAPSGWGWAATSEVSGWGWAATSEVSGDARVWQRQMIDRLIRRQAQVEAVDGIESERKYRKWLELGRLVWALSGSRPAHAQLELAGSDERLAGDSPRGVLPSLVAGLVPSTVTYAMAPREGPGELELGYGVHGLGAGGFSAPWHRLGGALRVAGRHRWFEEGGARWGGLVGLGVDLDLDEVRLTLEGTAAVDGSMTIGEPPLFGGGLAVVVGTALPVRVRAGVEQAQGGGGRVMVGAGVSDLGVALADGFRRPGWGELHSGPGPIWWLPYAVLWEPTLGGLRVGQGLRLRFGEGTWMGAADAEYVWRSLRPHGERASARFAVGPGYDLAGWVVDDLTVAPTLTLNARTVDALRDGVGVELSAVVLRVLRLGVALDRLPAEDRTATVSVGVVDINGLVAWLARAGAGFDGVRP